MPIKKVSLPTVSKAHSVTKLPEEIGRRTKSYGGLTDLKYKQGKKSHSKKA